MKWFKKDKSKAAVLPSFLERIIVRINHQLIKLADYLTQKMNRCSIKKQKRLLLLFCFLFTSASVLVLWNSFRAKHFTSIGNSNITVMPLLPSVKPMRHLLSIPELKRIQFFKSYLDSLNRTIKGRQIADSLLLTRPHLMDSLTYLDFFYTEFLKNETNGK